MKLLFKDETSCAYADDIALVTRYIIISPDGFRAAKSVYNN